MKFPSTVLPDAFRLTPLLPFPEITLRSAADSPPTVLPVEPAWMSTPVPLARAAVPPTFVPMKFPAIVFSPAVWRLMPPPLRNRLMASPRTVLPPAEMVNPYWKPPAPVPSSSMSGVPAKPGCVDPSMTTGSVTVGSALSGEIV